MVYSMAREELKNLSVELNYHYFHYFYFLLKTHAVGLGLRPGGGGGAPCAIDMHLDAMSARLKIVSLNWDLKGLAEGFYLFHFIDYFLLVDYLYCVFLFILLFLILIDWLYIFLFSICLILFLLLFLLLLIYIFLFIVYFMVIYLAAIAINVSGAIAVHISIYYIGIMEYVMKIWVIQYFIVKTILKELIEVMKVTF